MASASETTPLLPPAPETPALETTAVESPSPNEEADSQAPSPTSPTLVYWRAIRILNIVLFITSILCLVLTIATIVVFEVATFPTFYGSGFYRVELDVEFLGTIVLFAFLISAVNLKWNVPILLSMVVDVLVPFILLSYAHRFVWDWPHDGWCRPYRDDPPPDCLQLITLLQSLLYVCIGFAAAVTVSHVGLFLLRLTSVLKQRGRSWARQLVAWLPTGEITVSVTIRVLKQQRGMEAPQRDSIFTVEQGTLPEV